MGWFSAPSDFDKDIAKRSKSGNAEQNPWHGKWSCLACGRPLDKGGMGWCKCND